MNHNPENPFFEETKSSDPFPNLDRDNWPQPDGEADSDDVKDKVDRFTENPVINASNRLLAKVNTNEMVRRELEEKTARLTREKEEAIKNGMVDSNTGCFNKKYLDEYANQIFDPKFSYTEIAVLALDLDDLKATNDSLGHLFGDKLILGAAKLLKDNFRDDDVVVRPYEGGDEFLVICYNRRDDEHFIENLNKKLADLNEQGKLIFQNKYPDLKIDFSFSFGAAIHNKESNPNPIIAIKQAEDLMYEHKALYKKSRTD